MKFSIFILVVVISIKTHGQKRSDTLNQLMGIAEVYLNTMYKSQNFDSASKMWDDYVFLEAKQAYSFNKDEVIEHSTVKELVKTAYFKYYQKASDFKILDLTVYTFRPEIDGITEVRLLYHCTERINGKRKKHRVVLYFYSRDKGENWKLADSKVIDITKRYK